MLRTVTAAALLAALAMPAFAEDVIISNDDPVNMTKAETTSADPGQSDAAKTAVKDSGRYDGCMKRLNTALNMM
jgi:hypothetical protein